MTRNLIIFLVTHSCLFLSSCSLLIGNVRPVEEKSSNYKVLNLSESNPDWIKVEQQNESTPEERESASDISDISFQSKKTSSIISLNSACRKSYENKKQSLQDFTKLLLMGISDIHTQTEKQTTLHQTPALETTVHGKLNGQDMKLRAIVLQQKDCVYDLMYVSRPEKFDSQLSEFENFFTSLKLK